jgi:hypothetical protein
MKPPDGVDADFGETVLELERLRLEWVGWGF